ncbi:MAG: outer membrane lipoprotein carrier protein LolA [Gammaproteobacteria bacterium]|nr:outer membrane lipoprotein carrier protein LolA [Gammaproteobacteria bacterium]MDH3749070.1 outer membrane lipoprotein carrier protein LolA [Gammaproteobacteria bacterium]MDH3804492.1 outer membrane lipoprotein carrier protein LolA [Gammaproteobacteria bacterium]
MRALPTTRPDLTLREECNRQWLTALLLAASMALTAPFAWCLELAVVLENSTVTPPNSVGFREERHNPMLKEPLVLTGHLEYLRAGVLRKSIETPFEESFLIESDHVVIEREGETRKLALNKSRSLKTILSAIEAILSGEAGKIESVFNYYVAGTQDAWSVQLTPISRRMGKRLISLQVNGDDQSVTSIRIDLKNGEWHLMDILRNDPEP